MGIEWVREECLKYPAVTEHIGWEYHVVFRVGGKIFAITSPGESEGNFLSLKTEPEEFVEWIERPGVNPVPGADVRKMLGRPYDVIRGKLSKTFQASLPGHA